MNNYKNNTISLIPIGGGKTSIIIPFIVFFFIHSEKMEYYSNEIKTNVQKNKIFVIVPSHLIEQTRKHISARIF